MIQCTVKDLAICSGMNWELPWAQIPAAEKARVFQVVSLLMSSIIICWLYLISTYPYRRESSIHSSSISITTGQLKRLSSSFSRTDGATITATSGSMFQRSIHTLPITLTSVWLLDCESREQRLSWLQRSTRVGRIDWAGSKMMQGRAATTVRKVKATPMKPWMSTAMKGLVAMGLMMTELG